jgi:ATP-dependent phosphoenolpyruvate carboxykinase
MSTEVISPRTIRARSILKDLSREELRELARSGEKTSEYGSPVYTTRVKNRSAKNTYVVANGTPIGVMQQPIDREKAEETIRQVQETLAGMELIQVDRRMGMNPEVPIHCRLYVPREYARIAYMWNSMLFPSDSSKEPDFLSVYVPDWPERLIFLDVDQGYTYILGTDYPGEAKKSMLRQAMYWIKRRGGLGLHAGSKVLRVVGPDGELRDVGFLLFGLSGTGKTTLTLHDHGLEEPERAIIKQDDVVLMTADGRAFGTEDGFYIKTEGLEPSQKVLWGAATHETAVYENIKLDENGKVDFLDTSITSNGRGVVLRKFIRGTGEGVEGEQDRLHHAPQRRRARLCPADRRAGGGVFHARGVDRDVRRRPHEGRPGEAGSRHEPVHRRPRVRGGQPPPRDPARQSGHGGVHPEHRLDRRERRISRREGLDPGLDRDHEADREGRDRVGEGSRLGIRDPEGCSRPRSR